MKSKTSSGSWFIAVIVVVAAVVAGVYLFRRGMQGDTPTTVASTPSSPTPVSSSSTASTPIRYPIADIPAEPAGAPTEPLPTLDDSDASVLNAWLAMPGGDALQPLLMRDRIIMRMVATVDALPRQGIGHSILPVRTPQGQFGVDRAQGVLTISDRNIARYAPYMAILAQMDMPKWVSWYKRNYPLFQQAYRELGYPRGYFNDRLIAAIDDMLRAPEPDGPVELVFSGARYRYADPGMQSLSVGQKLMMRIGTTHEAAVKAKLHVLRSLLSKTAPP